MESKHTSLVETVIRVIHSLHPYVSHISKLKEKHKKTIFAKRLKDISFT